MKPLKPFIIEGKRYLHICAAARTANVSKAAMSRWCNDGVTSFGLELDVVPYSAPRHPNQRPAENPRDARLLIPEAKVMLLKRLLRDFPLNAKGGSLSEYERETLRLASRQYSKQSDQAPQP